MPFVPVATFEYFEPYPVYVVKQSFLVRAARAARRAYPYLNAACPPQVVGSARDAHREELLEQSYVDQAALQQLW